MRRTVLAERLANFPGDETTDWSRSSGLASLTTDMLSRALGGAYGYGTDIGGYSTTAPRRPQRSSSCAGRWAALSPVFRLHGSGRSDTHTPSSYDAQTVRIYNALSRLHLKAVPVILALWRHAARTGMPVTRPLWLQYPGDRRARREDQEWLWRPERSQPRDQPVKRGAWRRRPGGRALGPLRAPGHATRRCPPAGRPTESTPRRTESAAGRPSTLSTG